MRYGIIAAIKAEAGVFATPRGRLFEIDEYQVYVAGPGRENAARAANNAARDGCQALLSWGVAGALDDTLTAGMVVITHQAMTGAGEILELDAALAQRIMQCAGNAVISRPGSVLTVAEAATSAREKEHLRTHFAATVVDLESTAIAYVARSAGLSCACVRAVVDPAAFSVPGAALAGLDENGELHVLRTLAKIIERPGQLAPMLHLAGHFRRALTSLRAVARQITA